MNPNMAFPPAEAPQVLRSNGHRTPERPTTVLRFLALAFLLATTPAWGQRVLSTLPVSGQPFAMAVNAATNRIFVSGEEGVVTILDGVTGARLPVEVGGRLGSVVLNPATNRVYVAHPTEGTVTVIDGATQALTTLSVVPHPRSLVVNPVTNKVYVANEGAEGVVAIIDGATNHVAILTVDAGPYSYRHVAVDPVANRIYVTKDGDGTFNASGFGALTVLDGATDTVVGTWFVGSRHSWYSAIAVNPVTSRIYVSDTGYGSVYVVDGTSGATLASFGVGSIYPVGPMVVNPVTNRLYVVNYDRVVVFDGATHAELAAIPVGPNAVPLAVDPIRNRIYVANPENGTVTVIDGATHAAKDLIVGSRPHSLAINLVTNRVYVGNTGEASVSVIDGATYRLEKLPAGIAPTAVVTDPVTHRLYVTNFDTASVTVLDPTTGSTETVKVGTYPSQITFDPVANRAYVLSTADSTLTVIDGDTKATITVPVLPSPRSLVLNPATGRAYILGQQNSLMLVEGGTYRTTLLPVGFFPGSLAVNPSTNRIYVEDAQDFNLRVLDGSTHALLATVVLGKDAGDLAVDPVRNRIYVASSWHVLVVLDGETYARTEVPLGTGDPDAFNPPRLVLDPTADRIFVTSSASYDSDHKVTMVDGATHASATQPLAWLPGSMDVNPRTGQLFIVSHGAGSLLTVIDGATFSKTELAIDPHSGGISVDPGTNKVYFANAEGATVTELDLDEGQPVPMAVTVQGRTDAQTIPDERLFVTTSSSPVFTVSAACTFTESPAYAGLSGVLNPPITSLYYRVGDGLTADWRRADQDGPAGFTLLLPDQKLGVHLLHLFATYGEEGGGASMGWGGTMPVPVLSQPQSLPFAVLPIRTMTVLTSDANPQNEGRPVTFTATVRPDHAGASAPSGAVTFRDGPVRLGEGTLVPTGDTCLATFQAPALAEGDHTITATYPGDARHAGSTGELVERIAGMPATLRVQAGNDQVTKVKHPFPGPLVVQVLDGRGIPVPNVSVAFLGAGLDFTPSGTVQTDASGQASVMATPTRGGHLTVTATVSGVGSTAVFTLTAGGKRDH